MDYENKLNSDNNKYSNHHQSRSDIKIPSLNLNENNEKENYHQQHPPRSSSVPRNFCCTKCACVCFNEFLSNENNNNNDNTNIKKEPDTEDILNKVKNDIKNASKNSSYQKHKSKTCLIEPRPRPCMITNGTELVPLLARRRALQRPISLSTTDVTRYRDSKEDDWTECNVQYLKELNRQINRKERDIKIQREYDVESSKQHFDTWDTFWGRPGHGAPRDIKTKLNLDNLLYKMQTF